ncbi:AAA family ATPase [Paraburkholderia silviterrae]|uniref:histidine kinase n=1 Tax=Paraburkholderia silviterrae TaxID=2528715 RepID=A0A4R5M8E4_9BURK|nr:AAA family ATPase [Paraburkholderia silviterrae]TDG22775.1 GAF domain-containing protein [Paraburkholderia silviterrae]
MLRTFVQLAVIRSDTLTVKRGLTGGSQPVLLFVPSAVSPSKSIYAGFRNELALASQLDAAWAAMPLGLTHHENTLALAVEDPGGDLLDALGARSFDLVQRLLLALAIIESIKGMHAQGITHTALSPRTILVSADLRHAWITGFSNATRVRFMPEKSRSEAEPEPELDSGAVYRAPEQTPGSYRYVDCRADLYAFGVVLHELLTGFLPLPSCERNAAPPGDGGQTVPSQLLQIVTRLLEPEADDRYQSAGGVQADLLCGLDALSKSRTIPTFALGAYDTPPPLNRPHRLRGRDAHVETLKSLAGSVASKGRPTSVFVTGGAGSGKSVLIDAVCSELRDAGWRVATGKFDQGRGESPFRVLNEALGNLVASMVASGRDLEPLRRDALAAVGQLGALISEAIPESRALLGDPRPAPEASPDAARMRWHEVLARFIGVFAQASHPLVIFLDDTQWADTATVQFVTEMLERRAIQWLLFIGASREGEVTSDRDLYATLSATRTDGNALHRLPIEPLSRSAVADLVADMLGVDAGGASGMGPLVELLYARAEGNPLFTIQLMRKFADERLIAQDTVSRVWNWDLDAFGAAADAPDLPELMQLRVSRLPANVRDTLAYFACMGNVAAAPVLGRIVSLDDDALRERLRPAVSAGLILPRGDDYLFVHDRIQEAVDAMQTTEERAGRHLAIAGWLRTLPASLAQHFDVADHLNRATSLLRTTAARLDAAACNLNAARQAKASGAHVAAGHYLGAGRRLMQQDDPRFQHPLHVQLCREAAHCALLAGDLGFAGQMIDQLHGIRLAKDDIVEVALIEVTLNVLQSHNEQAAGIALQCLKDCYGMVLPQYPSGQEARDACEAVFRKLGAREIEALAALEDMDDPEIARAMDLLSVLLLPTFYTNPNLFVLHLAKLVELTLDHGLSENSAHAFSSFGMVIGDFLGHYQEGYRFGVLANEIVNARGFFAVRAKTLVGLELVSYWTQPLHRALEVIHLAREAAEESGEFDIACTVRSLLVTNMLAIGSPLDETRREAESGRLFNVRAGYHDGAQMLVVQLCFIDAMSGRTLRPSCFDSATFSEAAFERELAQGANASLCCMYWVMKGKTRCLAGEFDEAERAFRQAEAFVWSLPGFFQLFDFHFFWGLTCAALLGTPAEAGAADMGDVADEEDRRLRHARLRTSLDKLAQWADACEATFADKLDLLRAESARLDGHPLEALEHYESAIRRARENGFLHHEGIALERAAGFCRERGLEVLADSYVQHASQAFLKWGAHAKAAQMENARTGPWHVEDNANRLPKVQPLDEDTRFVMETTRTLSSEVVVERLIEKLMIATLTWSGADFGALARCRRRLEVVATATREGAAVTVDLADGAVTAPSLPLSLLHGALASLQRVVLDAAAIKRRYAGDAYFKAGRVLSVLCLPLVKHGQPLGVLYLEHRSATSELTASRIAVLEMIAAQAAISMEVAQLYADVYEENRERRRVEAMLRENEAALAQAQRIGGTANWYWSVESGEVACSAELLLMLGIRLNGGPLKLESIMAAVHPEDRDAVSRSLADAVQRRCGFRIQFRGLETEGVVRHFQAIGELQTGNGDPVRYVGTTLDITERENREQALQLARNELAHVTRVHTLGQLAASISHEVNQPLAAIMVNATAALRWLRRAEPDLGEVATALERIAAQGNRATEVIQNARSLVKRAPTERNLVSLPELVEDTLVLLQREIHNRSVALECDIASGLPMVVADRVQLQQVFLNLLLNAIEALRRVTGRRRWIRIIIRAIEPALVSVSIVDNGPGLAGVDAEVLYKSFYSTKADGLGMGLSICRSIIEAHGGSLASIEVAPPGAGFEFVLPAQNLGTRDGDAANAQDG